ncbi:MAG: hypothetical protein NUV77_05840 [Thermoguttaceae bacterium]|nr:hypothetical protein [Thermoguttaceae bacterium]
MRKIAGMLMGLVLSLGLAGLVGCGGEDPAKKPGFHQETLSDPSAVMKQMKQTGDPKGKPVVTESAKPAAEKPK